MIEATRLRVLLVEDDEVDRMAVRRAMKTASSPVALTECADVAAAVAAIEAEEFDCALVDFELPDGSAFDFLQALSGRAPDLPVVVLTGQDDDELAVSILQRGAQDFLRKGEIDAASMVRAIRHAVERSRVAELERRLVHADRLSSIGQLAAGVAHEVNNPLMFLLGNHDLILRELDGLEAPAATLARIRELIAQNRSSLDRIRHIVGELRVFSRVERDHVESIPVNPIIEGACNIMGNEIRHRAELVKDLRSEAIIAADAGKLAQLFINLLMNAAQAIAPGNTHSNRITIRTRDEPGGITVTIEDTGKGLAGADPALLFEPFYTTKSRDEGTGLGLPLCAEIARLHRGDVRIEDRSAGGARVVVRLPHQTGLTPTRSEPIRSPESEVEAAGARVLMIDDENIIGDLYARLLNPPHEVVFVRQGRDALDLLERGETFDVIVCDMMMPEMDGPQVYDALRERHPEMVQRVVFLTGGAFTAEAREFLADVPNTCLEKPIEIADLSAAISTVAAAGRNDRS